MQSRFTANAKLFLTDFTVMDRIHLFCVVLISICNYKVSGDCSLSLKKDFGSPSPVFIQNGGFLAPNATTGAILFRRSETLLVACPGERRLILLGNETTNHNVLEAHCINNVTFRVNRWSGPFKSIRCNSLPHFSSEQVSGGCLQGNKLYKVGYLIKDTFYSLYEACFDPDLVKTFYVKHELQPAQSGTQVGGQRPPFSEGGLFGTVKMAKLYKIKNQADRINQLLGGNSADKYISKNQFLTRGHLAPRADFALKAEQRASFHYVNSAPQWLRANAGPWEALEDGLRRRVSSLGRPLTVYTGTHGLFLLENGQEFYLTTDNNNNNVVPVPLYFYKIVQDPLSKKAVAFVSITSTGYNSSTLQSLTLCESVCSQYSWLKWKGQGNSCCSYDLLKKAGVRVPALQVKGLFVF